MFSFLWKEPRRALHLDHDKGKEPGEWKLLPAD